MKGKTTDHECLDKLQSVHQTLPIVFSYVLYHNLVKGEIIMYIMTRYIQKARHQSVYTVIREYTTSL